MNYLDGIIILIIILGSWRGYSLGIIVSLGGLMGRIISIVAAVVFARPLAVWLGETFGLLDKLSSKLVVLFPTAAVMGQAKMGRVTAQKLPEVLDSMHLPAFLKFKIMEQVPVLMESGSASLVAITQELSKQLALLILQVFAFIILIILVRMAIKLIVGLVNRAFRGTIVGSFNRALGLAAGFFLTSVILVILAGFLAPILMVTQDGKMTQLGTLMKNSLVVPKLLDMFGLISGAFFSKL